MRKMGAKNGFTMIELIFVIVIIGILAAVAIPKLAASRNDAKAAVIVTHLSNCIELASKGYLEAGSFDVNETNCQDITTKQNCFTLAADDANGTLNVISVASATRACKDAQEIAEKNNLSGTGSGYRHSF